MLWVNLIPGSFSENKSTDTSLNENQLTLTTKLTLNTKLTLSAQEKINVVYYITRQNIK